jgi:hypothetical protein
MRLGRACRAVGLVAAGTALAVTASAEKSVAGPSSGDRKIYAEDIKAAMKQHIASRVDKEGVFHLVDDKTRERLALKFVQIHDPVRQIGSDVYFACTDFHVLGKPEKIYDLDFWMNEKTGELRVYQSKVHKEPRWSLIYGWYKQPRYTFVNDEIEYLY